MHNVKEPNSGVIEDQKPDILIIDDEHVFSSAIKNLIDKEYPEYNFSVSAPDKDKVKDALTKIETVKKCVILDIDLKAIEDSLSGCDIVKERLEKLSFNGLKIIIYSQSPEYTKGAIEMFQSNPNIYVFEKAFDTNNLERNIQQLLKILDKILILDIPENSVYYTLNIRPENSNNSYFMNLPDPVSIYFANKVLNPVKGEELWYAGGYSWDIKQMEPDEKCSVIYHKDLPIYQIDVQKNNCYISVDVLWTFSDPPPQQIKWVFKKITDIKKHLEIYKTLVNPLKTLFELSVVWILTDLLIEEKTDIYKVKKVIESFNVESIKLEFQKLFALKLAKKYDTNNDELLLEQLDTFQEFNYPIVRNILKGTVDKIDNKNDVATINFRNTIFKQPKYKPKQVKLSILKDSYVTKDSSFIFVVYREFNDNDRYDKWPVKYQIIPTD